MNSYPLVIVPLSKEDGGGYLQYLLIYRDAFRMAKRRKRQWSTPKTPSGAGWACKSKEAWKSPMQGSQPCYVQNKIAVLRDAMKALIEYSEHADDWIESLECKLPNLKIQLQSDWRETDVFMAHVSAAKHGVAAKQICVAVRSCSPR